MRSLKSSKELFFKKRNVIIWVDENSVVKGDKYEICKGSCKILP